MIHSETKCWAVKKSKTVTAAKPKRLELLTPPMKTHGHDISFGTIFLGKMKLKIIFYRMGQTIYESQLLRGSYFYFLMIFLLNILFICCYLA